MHYFYCLLLFICSYFALVAINSLTSQVKSLWESEGFFSRFHANVLVKETAFSPWRLEKLKFIVP